MQFKNIALEQVQLKQDGHSFEGYASRFNGVDAYGDTIVPGAFADTLTGRNRPVRMRWNHWGPVIGKWLSLEEDDVGLRVKGQLTKGHSVAEDVRASMLHGAVDGMSIGFIPTDVVEDDEKRLIKEVNLIEISVVEEPADLGAKVDAVKMEASLIKNIESLSDAEAFLREASGFSRSTAKLFVSHVKTLREAEILARDERSRLEEMANLFNSYKR